MIDAGQPHYGLRRDGAGDNAAAFGHIMADARATQQGVSLPPGRYQSSYVAGFSGLSLIGENRATTVLALHPDCTAPLFGVSGCDDVLLLGITFDGQMPKVRDGVALVSMLGGARNRMLDCAVQNVPYIGLEIAYGRDTLIEGCYFSHTGKLEVTPEGGAAIWIGWMEGRPPTIATTIRNCLFEDLEWSAVYSCCQFDPASDVTITNCTTRRTKESAFFLYGSRRVTVENCTIEDVTVKNISASGIESGGWVTARGNKIRRTMAQAISLQHCIDAIVTENECTMGGAITHLSLALDPATLKLLGAPRNSEISRNAFDGTPGARIWLGGQDGAVPIQSFVIADNKGLYPLDAYGGVQLDPAFVGERVFVQRNLTAPDLMVD